MKALSCSCFKVRFHCVAGSAVRRKAAVARQTSAVADVALLSLCVPVHTRICTVFTDLVPCVVVLGVLTDQALASGKKSSVRHTTRAIRV